MLLILVTCILVTSAYFPVVSQAKKPDGASLIDDDLLQKYVTEIRELRNKGLSWKEVEDSMGIWWPEDEERAVPERFETRGRSGETEPKKKTEDEEVEEMIQLLYKRLAEDQERLENHPEGPKETKYTIPIIRYVANLDEDLLVNLGQND